jgi:hypothetical protein
MVQHVMLVLRLFLLFASCCINTTNNIVTDFSNALPGNSSVNTVQHITIEEAVFSVSAVTSHNSG